MMKYTLSIFLTLATLSKAIHYHAPYYTVASEAQIRFALENKYDDTGPGAKEPEYAYNTYKTLDEALLGYLDDPDTKLPEHERERVLTNLARQENKGEYKPDYGQGDLMFKRYYPKTVEEYTGYNQQQQQDQFSEVLSKPKHVGVYKGFRLPQPQLVLTKLRTSAPKKFYQSQPHQKTIAEPYRVEKVKQPFRPNPSAATYYNRDVDLKNAHDEYDPHPKYTFSYGVHVPDTGDTKSAQETREGGTVRGYYSFVDPDGKLRTVHYTADDKEGFKATVERE